MAAHDLTEAEMQSGFRSATAALPKWFAKDVERGMTDEQLGEALKKCLGIWGGTGGPGLPWTEYTGSGIKIWVAREIGDMRGKPPLFKGAETISMARKVYRIADPAQKQMALAL